MPRESKRRSKKAEIDVTRFEPLVEEALRAFSEDVSYAVQMARAAVTIEHKRSVWRIREEVNKAEAAARAECETKDFVCPVDNPCGTGSCRFAKGELAHLDIYAPGTVERPHNSVAESYSTAPVVKFIHSQRVKNTSRPANED